MKGDEDLLAEWLEAWEVAARDGQEVTPGSLVGSRVDLLPELELRVKRLRGLGWLDGLGGPAPRERAWDRRDEPVPGYVLRELLGRGGFGEVWRATSPDGSPTALKLVGEAGAAEWESVEAVKAVRHPNVLEVQGAWRTPRGLVLAMELADRSLLDRWRECLDGGLPGIPSGEVRRYFEQAADGLDALHAAGLQHRDVKPSNLLLVGDTVRVADFGLARLLEHSQASHTGTLTLAYAAPEFFEGRTSTTSDQYSLAVAYCQMRGGRLPFEGLPAQVVAGHLKRAPDLAMLPAAERPAVERALHKDPRRRWPTCRGFVDAIGVAARERRWTRRAFLGAGVVAVGGAGAAVALRAKPPPFWSRRLERPEGLDVVRSVAAGNIGPAGRLDNPRFVFAAGTGGAYLWDVDTGRLVHTFPFQSGASAALAPFWVPRGTAADDTGAVLEYDLESGAVLRTYQASNRDVNGVAYSPDGQSVWAAGSDGTVRQWSTRTGESLRTLTGHEGIVTSVAVGSTNRLVLSGGWDARVIVWDAGSGKAVHRLEGHTAAVQSVAMAEDGRLAASGSWDGTVRLWDLQSGRPVRVLEGHEDQVRAVTFAGRTRVVSAGYDRTVRVWELGSGAEVFRSPTGNGRLEGVCLVPSRESRPNYLAVGTGGDGVWVCLPPADLELSR